MTNFKLKTENFFVKFETQDLITIKIITKRIKN